MLYTKLICLYVHNQNIVAVVSPVKIMCAEIRLTRHVIVIVLLIIIFRFGTTTCWISKVWRRVCQLICMVGYLLMFVNCRVLKKFCSGPYVSKDGLGCSLLNMYCRVSINPYVGLPYIFWHGG